MRSDRGPMVPGCGLDLDVHIQSEILQKRCRRGAQIPAGACWILYTCSAGSLTGCAQLTATCAPACSCACGCHWSIHIVLSCTVYAASCRWSAPGSAVPCSSYSMPAAGPGSSSGWRSPHRPSLQPRPGAQHSAGNRLRGARPLPSPASVPQPKPRPRLSQRMMSPRSLPQGLAGPEPPQGQLLGAGQVCSWMQLHVQPCPACLCSHPAASCQHAACPAWRCKLSVTAQR